jgi:hypothetical protein
MTVSATSAAGQTQNTAPPSTEPPRPRLDVVQQGDLAAGRIRVAEGQVFSGTSDSAPATSRWGDQPSGSGYREAFDSAAARLGTRDATAVSAELDRQLYAAAPIAPAPTPTPAPGNDSEGIGSFVEGAVLGDFGNNSSWSATAGQVAVGFVPIVGQIADARDTIASLGQVIRGEEGGWLNLGASVIGWVPGVGDAAKAAIRGGSNALDAGSEVAQGVARQADDVGDAARGVDAGAPKPDVTPPKLDPVAETSLRTGIPEDKIREILATPKPDRPAPSTYMSDAKIRAHLKPFEESGAIKFTPQSTLDQYGTLGPPDGGFVIPRSQFEALIEETGGDLAKVEDKLQLNPGDLTGGNVVIAYIAPEDLSNLRIPSGNERGAWEGLWVPGGFTGKGVPEAVVDLPASTPYTRVSIGE